jgi:large repetitive protein
MLRARTGFDSVLLGDGSVLAVGDDFACFPGPAQPGSERAERYDPTTDTWTEAASLNKPRKSFAMVALAEGGAVVVGGINPDDVPYSSTKIFDPDAGTWSDGPLLERAVGDPVAATLADGRTITLSPRAYGETGYATAVELLDLAASRWETRTEVEFYVGSVLALTDGGLLVSGWAFESPPLLSRYDPADDSWTNVAAPIEIVSSLDYGNFGPLVALDDGAVLALNVAPSSSDPFPSTRVERFDRATRRWSEVASISTPREGAMITRLADGRVFVAGGATANAEEGGALALATTEIYDAATDRWSAGPDLLEPRKDGHALLLEDGSILIHGGDASFNVHGDVPWCPDPMTSTERIFLGP